MTFSLLTAVSVSLLNQFKFCSHFILVFIIGSTEVKTDQNHASQSWMFPPRLGGRHDALTAVTPTRLIMISFITLITLMPELMMSQPSDGPRAWETLKLYMAPMANLIFLRARHYQVLSLSSLPKFSNHFRCLIIAQKTMK